jgi:hypothetical protein
MNSENVRDITCHHIRVNGIRCGSPRLTGKQFCFWHNKVNNTHSEPDNIIFRDYFFNENNVIEREQNAFKDYDFRNRRPNGPRAVELPPLEDSESIQLALSMVVAAIADGRIEIKRAGIMIYALQVASQNVLRTKRAAEASVQDIITDYAGREIAAPQLADPPTETVISTEGPQSGVPGERPLLAGVEGRSGEIPASVPAHTHDVSTNSPSYVMSSSPTASPSLVMSAAEAT